MTAQPSPALLALIGRNVSALSSHARGVQRTRGELVAVDDQALTLRCVTGKFAGRTTVLLLSTVAAVQEVEQETIRG